jgi:hypothetical protein
MFLDSSMRIDWMVCTVQKTELSQTMGMNVAPNKPLTFITSFLFFPGIVIYSLLAGFIESLFMHEGFRGFIDLSVGSLIGLFIIRFVRFVYLHWIRSKSVST